MQHHQHARCLLGSTAGPCKLQAPHLLLRQPVSAAALAGKLQGWERQRSSSSTQQHARCAVLCGRALAQTHVHAFSWSTGVVLLLTHARTCCCSAA